MTGPGQTSKKVPMSETKKNLGRAIKGGEKRKYKTDELRNRGKRTAAFVEHLSNNWEVEPHRGGERA